jgi:hypothetical protein
MVYLLIPRPMSVGDSLEMQISVLHEKNYQTRETESVHLVILLRVAMSFAAEQKERYHPGTRTTEKVDLLPRNGPLVELAMLNAV